MGNTTSSDHIRRPPSPPDRERPQDALKAWLEEAWSTTSNEDAAERPSLDCLPDELLLMVLSHVDGCQGSDRDLLALRRVCRRWNDLLLTPAPWRSRREFRWEGWPDAAVLRVLPALDKVQVSIWCDKDDAHFDPGLLGTLAESSCEVTCLDVRVVNRHPFIIPFQQALEKRSETLHALKLDLEITEAYLGVGGSSGILEAVDSLRALKQLQLSFSLIDTFYAYPISNFRFHRLRTLEGLRIWDLEGAPLAIARSLLECNCDTLVTVDVRERGLTDSIARCTRLRDLQLPASSDLHLLEGLNELEKLTVECHTNQDLDWLTQYLKLDRRPKQVTAWIHFKDHETLVEESEDLFGEPNPSYLDVDLAKLCTPSVAASWRGLHGVALEGLRDESGGNLTVDTAVALLSSMPALEELRIMHASRHESISWEALVQRWTPRCAPNLKRLEVATYDRGPWLEVLKARYPNLVVTTPRFYSSMDWHTVSRYCSLERLKKV